MGSNYKIVEGSEIQGNSLRLPRAISIYKAAKRHEQVGIISCKRKSDLSEVIIIRLSHLNIPDLPDFPIQPCEDVAIRCLKEDLDLPEVYAIRKDFPTGLPHSNIRQYERPVSLCVSDVYFSDIRPQFNAFDFINSIIRWFNLNSIGELHEKDRPLEVFFQYHDFCGMVNSFSSIAPYGVYNKKTEHTSTLEFVDKAKANSDICLVVLKSIVSKNLAFLPKNIGELNTLETIDGKTIIETIIDFARKTDRKSERSLLLMLGIQQKNAAPTSEDKIDLAIVKLGKCIHEIENNRKKACDRDTFNAWLSSLPIKVEMLLENPCREINASQNGKEKQYSQVTFIGTGTLGSNIIDHFVREGISNSICIVDFDIYFSHNISRHILQPRDIMKPKASCIKKHFEGIVGTKIWSIDKNVMCLSPNEEKAAFDNTDLIVDASTSIAVERKLALSSKYEGKRKCTLFLNPKGNDLVLLLEDANGEQRLDLLEMSYQYNLIKSDTLANHLDTAEQRKTNNFSCRSESNVLDYDNVGMLASVASQQIQRATSNTDCLLGIWRVNDKDSTISKINLDVLSWNVKVINNISVYYSKELVAEIDKYRNSDLRKETGGCLFGCYDKDARNIYVFYQHHAPKDSKCSATFFERGCNGMNEVLDKINKRTYHQVRYLGEWHSHPNACCSPSSLDKEQFTKMSEQMSDEDLPFVQLIMGTNGIYLNAIM